MGDVLDLDPARHHHLGDPDTARAAATAAMHPSTVNRNVKLVMSAHGAHDGLTDDELLRLLPELGHTAKARASDLRQAGLLEDTQVRRLTRRGRPAAVYRPTLKGRMWSRVARVPEWVGARLDELDDDGAVESATITRLMGECPLCGDQYIGRTGLNRHLRGPAHGAVG